MAQPSQNVEYAALPLTTDQHYPPPSPIGTNFSTPLMGPNDLPRDEPFVPPQRFMGNHPDSNPAVRDSYASSQRDFQSAPQSVYGSVHALNDSVPYRDNENYSDNEIPMSPVGQSRALNEKNAMYAPPRTNSRKKIIIGAIIAAILIIAAVVVALYFTVIKPKTSQDDDGESSDSHGHGGDHKTPEPTSTGPRTVNNIVTGGDGSTVTMDDGTTFKYQNKFKGYWYYDPNDPFNGGGKAQSWSPAINESFKYGQDRIYGVNLGGWLVLEPFISPALYEKYANANPPAIDEWTLSQAMRADTAGGGINQLEEHYKTFITEKDFADIAAAGLNWVRIPIGWWAIETRGDEPFLPKVSWNYFLKAIKWARKYGLRINLDLHAIPGSQNGWNHSGKWGNIGFLKGPMGYANAQRTLDYIRIFTEFISQPQYSDVVPMFGILNEPQGQQQLGQDALGRFYWEVYQIVRKASGIGEGKGPYISFHDGFFARSEWADTFPNADRVAIDTHPYVCFGPQSANPVSSYVNTPCNVWAGPVRQSMATIGVTTAGEWSLAVTDCGLFLNGVELGTRYDGTYKFEGPWPRIGSCTPWTDYQSFSATTKQDMMRLALSSMDALQDFFFWTWRIGPSLASGKVETPHWSYSLGLSEGWMPTDPRDSKGACNAADPPTLQPWQTGGSGAGNIPASVTTAWAWPPASFTNVPDVSLLPSYTPTGPIPTLTATPITAGPKETMTKTADVGNGWNEPSDTQGVFVEIAGCSYPDPWVDPTSAPPPPCAAAARREAAPVPNPLVTPAPL